MAPFSDLFSLHNALRMLARLEMQALVAPARQRAPPRQPAEVGILDPAPGLSQGQQVNHCQPYAVCSVPANQQRSAAPEG